MQQGTHQRHIPFRTQDYLYNINRSEPPLNFPEVLPHVYWVRISPAPCKEVANNNSGGGGCEGRGGGGDEEEEEESADTD
jgi:hypothetical protein